MAKQKSEIRSSLKKYREIIISIVLFLLFNLSILSLNYYQSFKVADSAITINLASQQAGLIQDIAKNLTDINLTISQRQQTGESLSSAALKEVIFKQFNSLQHSEKSFTQALNTLKSGGTIIDDNGKSTKIKAIEIPSAANNLIKIHNTWTPFKGMIEHFITDYQRNDIRPEVVSYATDYARIYTTRLLLEIEDISQILQNHATRQADFIKLIQIIGIVVALSIFSFIVFRALRALVQSDIALGKSRRETAEIMDTITEGLFLIDENNIIGEQQSRKLASLLPVENITGKKLDEVLTSFVSENDIINTRRFIKQLFNRKTRENLIADLNPLRRVALNDSDGKKYLRFGFTRSYEDKKIVHALVSVTDITEAVEFEEQLEKERKQNEKQFDMLMKLLRIEPNVLSAFMQNATQMSDKINLILQQKGNSRADLEQKNEYIFREVHSFKGEASALQLTGFVDIAENMENHLKLLRTKPDLNGNDFLRITILLEDFFKLANELNNIRHRLISNLAPNDTTHTPQSIDNFFNDFAQQIAKRNGKQVVVHINGFQNTELSAELQQKLKEITIQLLRNAIVHGIEPPQTRISLGKSAAGNIHITLQKKSAGYQVLVADDGAGINKDTIRRKLVERNLCSQQTANTLDDKTLLRAIFTSGFSTQDSSTEDAGRGVGMDIVKDRIQSLGGKMHIDTKDGQYTHFAFTIPFI